MAGHKFAWEIAELRLLQHELALLADGSMERIKINALATPHEHIDLRQGVFM